ncbi:36.4 KDA PROLINE-RICH PROTEIN [Salix koriyanagi]|uniref:36.4 kDa PROLINE-RICH PROTEIN n=1 Tax=Salix koriyanagi TaxID=2511006 RepID=A0A9Q0VEL2_9ROSI|nr:36.4 KDA PROLINE-RICH PROTEIN [Salix koriyanagi]
MSHEPHICSRDCASMIFVFFHPPLFLYNNTTLHRYHHSDCLSLSLSLSLFLARSKQESVTMDCTKVSAFFFLCMIAVSSAAPTLDCGSCGNKHPKHKHPKTPKGPITLPPLPVPPIVKPPVTLPPVTLPPVTVPPVTTKPPKGKPCPPPPSPKDTCPIDTLKLGACVDLLGGLVHIGLGDPVVNQCCPVLQGLVELEAAVCLCTTLRIKALNLNIYVPLALQLLVTCGKTPPPGYTCSL